MGAVEEEHSISPHHVEGMRKKYRDVLVLHYSNLHSQLHASQLRAALVYKDR